MKRLLYVLQYSWATEIHLYEAPCEDSEHIICHGSFEVEIPDNVLKFDPTDRDCTVAQRLFQEKSIKVAENEMAKKYKVFQEAEEKYNDLLALPAPNADPIKPSDFD